MNNKKFAFILCVNNSLYFEECQYYIHHLNIPDGFEIEIVDIREANGMCAAYNLGMQSSDAKYKVYMHQDVFIRNKDFLKELLTSFEKDSDVGMIGMVGGYGMPKNGVAYLAWNAGTVDCREPDMAYQLVCSLEEKKDTFVDAVDGLLIATQYDLPWRDDLFLDFDFYDVSQSFEMLRRGYKILVPYQEKPWVIHDSGFAKLNHYDKNRKLCLEEYPEFLTEEGGFAFVYHEEWEQLSELLANQIKNLLNDGAWEEVASIIAGYRENKMKNSMLEMYGIMSDIYQKEKEERPKVTFFENLTGYEAIYKKYISVRFFLRRMEEGMPEAEYEAFVRAVKQEDISCGALTIILLHGVLDKKKVLQKMEGYYIQAGKKQFAEKMKQMYSMIKDKGLPIAYCKRLAAESRK